MNLECILGSYFFKNELKNQLLFRGKVLKTLQMVAYSDMDSTEFNLAFLFF